MKSFEMLIPDAPKTAASLLAEHRAKGAQLIAGGQDLLGLMKDHLVEPEVLVDLKKIAGLDAISMGAGSAPSTFGALVTLDRLEHDAEVRGRFPMLAQAAASVGSPQIRSVGTLGGNLCQRPRCPYFRNELAKCLKKGGTECFAYAGNNRYSAILGGGPSFIVHPSDLAPALVALEATVNIVGPSGSRSLALEDFFVLPSEGDVTRETVLAPDEVLTSVIVASKSGWKSTYLKVRERDSFDFALAAVALALEMRGETIASARLVLGGVAPIPWRAKEAEQSLVGKKIDAASCKAAGEAALRGAEPLAMNAYKIPMTKGLITRALQALARG